MSEISAAQVPSPRARRAIVTGGSSGIGAEVCRALLAAGYDVINLSLQPVAVPVAGLKSVSVDLRDPVASRRIFATLAVESPATSLVHCAGAVRERPVEDVTVDDLDALTHLHLGAALGLVQANLPAMKQASFGRIVLVSTRAVLGLAKRTAYASTKAGLLGMARTWALELAPFGVTTNVVSPGPIDGTEMFHEIVPVDSPRRSALAKSIPVGRLGTPSDVARAILFFLSADASFITGQTLYVCGGTSVGGVTL